MLTVLTNTVGILRTSSNILEENPLNTCDQTSMHLNCSAHACVILVTASRWRRALIQRSPLMTSTVQLETAQALLYQEFNRINSPDELYQVYYYRSAALKILRRFATRWSNAKLLLN